MQHKNDPDFSENNKSSENPNEEINSIELAPPDMQSQVTQANHYSSEFNNPKFNQLPSPYPMGISNSQFNQLQDQDPMGIDNPQFNQPQAQYPLRVIYQKNSDMTKEDNILLYHSQTNQVVNANVNSSTVSIEEKPFNPRPPNYKCLAFFSCLCCFWPLGLFAVCKSYDVDSAFIEGNLAKSQTASVAARRYALISIGLGVVLTCLVLVLNIVQLSAI